jgi:hypothetical protein
MCQLAFIYQVCINASGTIPRADGLQKRATIAGRPFLVYTSRAPRCEAWVFKGKVFLLLCPQFRQWVFQAD